jgi:hypothetical protein
VDGGAPGDAVRGGVNRLAALEDWLAGRVHLEDEPRTLFDHLDPGPRLLPGEAPLEFTANRSGAWSSNVNLAAAIADADPNKIHRLLAAAKRKSNRAAGGRVGSGKFRRTQKRAHTGPVCAR